MDVRVEARGSRAVPVAGRQSRLMADEREYLLCIVSETPPAVTSQAES